MKPYLTEEQRKLISLVRRFVESFQRNRGRLPGVIYLTPKQYKTFRTIQRKKKKFPRENIDVRVSPELNKMFGCDVKIAGLGWSPKEYGSVRNATESLCWDRDKLPD